MQFKVGDSVVHPAGGVGDIVKIEERQFAEIEARLYYQIALPRSTLWIPVEAQETIGLRPVTAKSELDQYRDLLQSAPAPRNQRHPQQGHLELSKRLQRGSFLVMCEIVRDLTVWDWQKPLGATTKVILRQAQEKLYQEWATAADLTPTEAAKEIDTLLKTAHGETML